MKPTILSLILFASVSCAVAESVYLQSGVSATSREWRAADYKKLADLVVAKKVPLPHLKDEVEAKVLQRFCSVDNLAYGKNKTLPLAARMQDAMEIQPAVSALLKIYLNEALKGSKVSDESALIMGFMLDISSLQIELVDEFVPSIKRDSGYEYRMNALKDMRGGLATVFVGAYSAVAEDKLFSDKNRSDILASLVRNTSRFATIMESDVKTEMIQKFTKLSEKMKEPKDQTSILAILTALKG
jgi:hypothetical protein